MLLECAWAAAHSRKSYLGAHSDASVNVVDRNELGSPWPTASSIAYHMLRNGVDFHDLGANYFDRMNTAKLKRYHLRRLAELGCEVSTLTVVTEPSGMQLSR